MPPGMKPVYYAVRGGSNPGLYTTWDEASKVSQGQSGTLCKKFKDEASAKAFLGSSESAPSAQVKTVGCSSSSSAIKIAQALPMRASANLSISEAAVIQSSGRTYLEVPFAEKDKAKGLGAKWDSERKKWFADSAFLLPALSKWLPGAPRAPPKGCDSKKRLAPSLFLPLAERQALAAVQPDELALYTDGACKGNNHVAMHSCPAGWGVAVVGGGGAAGCHTKGTGLLVTELFGPVVIDAASPYFLGAEVCSNNTGELSGICEALLWLLHHEGSSRSAAIFYDSKYAAKITTGEYRAEKNKELAAKARSLLQCVKKLRKVRFEHVKGHSSDKWNDAADRLANRGASGGTCSGGRYAPSSSIECAASLDRADSIIALPSPAKRARFA